MGHSDRTRPLLRRVPLVVRVVVQIVALVGLYYLVPVEPGTGRSALVLRLTLCVLGLGIVTFVILRQVQHHLRADQEELRLEGLLFCIVAGVVSFALADFVVATTGENEFAHLATKTDALYFAITTLATVGYGDIHASGQAARFLVMGQLVFNIVVLASAATLLGRRLREQISTGGSKDDSSRGDSSKGDSKDS